MKKSILYFTLLLLIACCFSACNDDDDNDTGNPSADVTGCYVMNYGLWGKGSASISKYDYDNDSLINNYYKKQNGSELVSNIEYAYAYKNQVFLISNLSDQIITLNDTLAQNYNGVADLIANPRACAGHGNYLYVSCWGDSPDYSEMSDSYIAKYNIESRTVEDTIHVPGGPEGVAIANGKLYAALNYKDSIAVIDLDDNSKSYIVTPAVSSYFVADNNDNLYVALVSTYSDYSESTGLGYINTSTDQLETIYSLDNVSTEYADILSTNSDRSKIYVIAASYDETGTLKGGVAVFDTTDKSFSSGFLISNIAGAEGVAVNPKNDDLYLLTSESATSAGAMRIYNSGGTFKKQYSVGIYPTHAVFLE